MTKILRNERVDEALAWAVKVIGGDEGIGLNCSAISLVDDKGDFIAVTLYSSYTGRNIDLHIAARYDTAWASRKYFQAAMELPFEVLRVARITGLIRSSNLRAQRFARRMGFQYEGRMREVFEDDDLVLYGFLYEEYLKHPWRKP
jgi:RimJ/RimL family protein N-acetyltransferase